MTFKIYNHNYNVPELVKQVGYKPIMYTEKKELNCVRPLRGADYPRFHVYLVEKPDILTFNLHLDQKKPSYGNETMHSGEYEGEIIKQEAQRIQDYIFDKIAK